MTKHFVVRLENRPGELAHLARALAARGVTLRHIASGGHGPYGFAYLETEDFEATHEVLAGLGYEFLDGETVVIECDDRRDCLAIVAEKLAAAGINIRSVMTVTRADGKVELALSVDEAERAREILGAAVLAA